MPDFSAVLHAFTSPPHLTTPEDSALCKAISRQHRGTELAVSRPSERHLELERPRLLDLRQRAHGGKHSRRQLPVDFNERNGIAARRIAADMKGRDIDAGIPQHRGEPADKAR